MNPSSSYNSPDIPEQPDGLSAMNERLSPNFATHVQLVRGVRAVTNSVKLETAKVELIDAEGKVSGSAEVLVESRPEDVVGIIPYTVARSRLTVYALECLRPALLARQLVQLPQLGECQTGRVVGELGGYLNQAGIASTVSEVLRTKAGLHPVGAPLMLGGVIHPNPGVSAELSIPVAVPVARPAKEEFVVISHSDNPFLDSRVVHALSAEQVIDSFLTGKINDPRMFVDTFNLLAVLEAEGVVVSELAPMPPVFKDALGRVSSMKSVFVPALDTADKIGRFWRGREVPQAIGRIDLESIAAADLDSGALFRSVALEVSNRNRYGQQVSAAYNAEAVVRSKDMLMVVVLGKIATADGERIVLPVNLGERPSLLLRDLHPRLLHTVTAERNLEGVWSSLDGEWSDRANVIRQVQELVLSATGHHVVAEPTLTEICGYYSPGFNSTGFRVAVACIDLDSDSLQRFPVGTALATPEAILAAQVRDLPLLTSAVIARLFAGCIEQKGASRSVSDASVPLEDRAQLNELMLSESPLLNFIRERSGSLLAVLKRHPVLANIITNRTNSGGMEILSPPVDSPERYFFNSLMQTFVVHAGDNPLRVLQLLFHDCWHYENPDPIPYIYPGDGEPKLVDYKEYANLVLENEVDAVMFSEVVLPTLMGIDQFEVELQDVSLAGLFRAAGVSDLEKQREAVRLAIRFGELSTELASFLKQGSFGRYEGLIREKLLGYYVRDTLGNVKKLYDSWLDMPAVGELANKFRTATASGDAMVFDPLRSVPARFSDRVWRLILDANGRVAASGRNPLLERSGAVLNYGLYKNALKLQYIQTALGEGEAALRTVLGDLIDESLSSYKELKYARVLDVTGIECSAGNAAVLRMLRQIEQGVVQRSEQLISAIADGRLGDLDAEHRQTLSSNSHAPFPILPFDPRQDRQAQELVSVILHRYALS